MNFALNPQTIWHHSQFLNKASDLTAKRQNCKLYTLKFSVVLSFLKDIKCTLRSTEKARFCRKYLYRNCVSNFS